MLFVRTRLKQQIHMKLTSHDTVQNLSDFTNGHVQLKPCIGFYLGFSGMVPYQGVNK